MYVCHASGSSYAIAAVMILTSGTVPRSSMNPFTDVVLRVSSAMLAPLPKQQVSQLESSSGWPAIFRLGTAAARVVHRLQSFRLLSLPMPGRPEGAGAGAGAAATGGVPNAPAVLGPGPPPAEALALAALHLACS